MPHITANGTGIEYEEFGSKFGTPFLLISGYGGQMINWSQEFVDGLVDEGFRVIRFDNRDIGLSQQFDELGIPDMKKIFGGLKDGTAKDHAPYLLEDMAADAAGLLEALDAKPAIVMGVSMGGMITQLLALNHPDAVKAIIPTMTWSSDPTLERSTPEANAVLTERPNPPSRENIIRNAIKANRVIGSGPSLQASDEELAEKAGAAYDRAYRPAGLSRQFAAIQAQPLWHERLSELSVPTLVVHGEVDTLILPQCGQDVAKRIPNARYVEIVDWGHDMPPKAVPVVLAEVIPFAKEHA